MIILLMTGCTPLDCLMLRFTMSQIEPWIYEDRRNDLELHYYVFLDLDLLKFAPSIAIFIHHPFSHISLPAYEKSFFFFFSPSKYIKTVPLLTAPLVPAIVVSHLDYSNFCLQSVLQSSSAPYSVSLGPGHLSTMTSLTLIFY